jgi:hypothetical protein
MEANTIASVVSAGIAVVSVLVGVYFTRKAIILQHQLKDLQQRATQLQYFAELRNWAGEAVHILAEAVHLSIMDRRVYKLSEFLRERRSLLGRLSAHVDRGRWFFPNIRQPDQGSEKEPGFRGFRHEVVWTLFWAYKVVGFLQYGQGKGDTPERSDLQKLQRTFAQQIQEVLDPGNLEREFRQVIGAEKGVSERQESELPTLAQNYSPEEMAAREMAEWENEREMLERERAETEDVAKESEEKNRRFLEQDVDGMGRFHETWDLSQVQKQPTAADSRPVPAESSASSSGEPPPAPTTSPAAPPDATLSNLIRAGVLVPPVKLFRKYKGKRLEATLLEDGAVEFQGKRYGTCSGAAVAARASVSGRRMHTTGWTFWQYLGPDGKKHRLTDARQQFIAGGRVLRSTSRG